MNTTNNSELGYVYHIKDPEYPDSMLHGYVGVVKQDRGVRQRFVEHKHAKSHIGHMIRLLNLEFETHAYIIFEGSMADCFEVEKQLRPSEKIGWNIASGGSGYNYTKKCENLPLVRSKNQKERMQNEELKKQQGETFKRNYYNDNYAQELRKRRAKEHMADPIKKQKCLTAIHKKKKCPYCEYANNAGNLAIHIKRKHPNE